MKSARISNCFHSFKRLLFAGICLAPSFASAHPGHYHPDETDEFDFLRATFFHTHGAFEYVLMGAIIANIAVICLNEKPAVRLGAFALAMASLGAITVL